MEELVAVDTPFSKTLPVMLVVHANLRLNDSFDSAYSGKKFRLWLFGF